MEKDGPIAILIIVILVIGTFAFAMTHEGDDGDGTPGPTGGGEPVTILGSTQSFATSGKGWLITAPALYANLNDGYSGNDPFILSVRTAEDYAKAHIPGAENIPWREVAKEDNLATLPTNKQIVVYCYTGHTATQVTALLNVLGYDAVTLKWGIASWTTNTTFAGSYYNRETESRQYPIVTGSEPGNWASGSVDIYRDIAQGCGDDDPVVPAGPTEPAAESEDVPAAADAWLSSGKPPAISAPSLYERLDNTDPADDPFIMSIRSADQYAIGHVPGAVLYSWKTMFTEETLATLPDDDTQIVVVCYTGHTASLVTALLGINGYNATALKWGMTSWSEHPDVAPSYYVRGTQTKNYEVVIGTEPGSMATGVVVGKTDYEIIHEAALGYLSGGTRFIKAVDLNAILDDGDASNDPFILSIRSAADYAIGHIPGAVNIAWRELFTPENLVNLPGDETHIVVVCYTGQTASHITALLNALGFNASTLTHGMCSWTTNTAIAKSCFDNTTHQADYPVVEGELPGTVGDAEVRNGGCNGGGPGEPVTFEGSSDEWEIVRQACHGYVAEVSTMYITNTAVYNNINDGYTANDPFILSVRSAADYAKGHVPGAVNIGAGALLEETNLEQLPMDRQIVVYCYTGQGAAHVSAMLNILGYDSISLKFGMCSWTDNSTIAPKCFSRGGAGNYKISTGTDPGDWATAAPAD